MAFDIVLRNPGSGFGIVLSAGGGGVEYPVTINANATTVSTLAKPSAKVLAVAVSSVKSLVRSITRPVAKNVVQAPTLTRSTARPITDNVTVTPSLAASKSFLKSALVNVSSIASLATLKSWIRSFQANADSTRTLSKQTIKPITITTAPTLTLIRAVPKALQAIATVLASINAVFESGSTSFNKSIDAVGTVSASLLRSAARNLTVSVSTTKTLVKSTARSILDNVSLVSSLAATSMKFRTISATSGTLATLIALKSFLRTSQANASAVVTLTRSTGKLILDNVSVLASDVMSTAKNLPSNISSVASLVSSKTFIRAHSVSVSLVATLRDSTVKILQAQGVTVLGLSKGISKPLPLNVSLVPTRTMSTPRSFQANSTVVSTLNALKVFIRTMSANASSVPSFARTLSKQALIQALAGQVTSIRRVTGKQILDNVSSVASRALSSTRRAQANASGVASLIYTNVIIRNFNALAQGVASASRTFGKNLTVTTDALAELARSTSKLATVTTAVLALRFAAVPKTITVSQAPVSTLDSLKALTRNLTVNVQVATTLVRDISKNGLNAVSGAFATLAKVFTGVGAGARQYVRTHFWF